MSLYDATKDAVKLAQKAGNIELVRQLLDVQQQALEMQEKQLTSNKKIDELSQQVAKLTERKKYKYDDGHSWMIDPDKPELKLCPTCLNRDGFENPVREVNGDYYCDTCKKMLD